MSANDWLALIGLLLGLVGSICLGVDVVLGAGQRFKAVSLKSQLSTLLSTRAFEQSSIRAHPNPLEVEAQLAEEEQRWGAKEKELREQLDPYEGKLSRYENRIVSLGALGALLLFLSFLLQALALYRNAEGSQDKVDDRRTSFSAIAERSILGPLCVGPFDPGSETTPDVSAQVRQVAAEIKLATESRRAAASIVVIGSADVQRLSAPLTRTYARNLELARGRAKRVAHDLEKQLGANARVVLVHASGPQIEARLPGERRSDRMVAVFVLAEAISLTATSSPATIKGDGSTSQIVEIDNRWQNSNAHADRCKIG
jgi:hypothetical protein